MAACLVIDHRNFLTTPAGFGILQTMCVDRLQVLNILQLSKVQAKYRPDEIPFREEEARIYKFHDC